ncbi:MAG: ATP-binding protein, partial [Tenericutes bacterium]|nr:ATP-binding protein [Mycoplasmatota bacterium]
KYTSKGFIEMRVNSIIKYDVCRLIIVIEDSGKGIDVLKHNEIMSNHDDLTKSEINNIDDSNLNLKVVKKMLNLIGGTFTIRSEEGMGTSVQVIIDQKIVPDEITSEEKSILKYNENLLKKKKIAVVSINADSIKVIKSVNRRVKNDLFLFDVTKDLLDELRGGKHYDLVYIDENMDKIDARSFIYKIKVEQIACNVIVISSNKDFNNKKDLLDLGFKMVLFEPIKKDDVSESIKLIDNF